MDNRPTFYNNNNNKTEPIRAGGIIFYKIDELTKQIKMLMQYTERIGIDGIKRNVYEDIGGKTDEKDTNINDTIIRETIEETNNIITEEMMKEHLTKNIYCIYSKKSKYCLLLIEANKNVSNIDRRTFGKKEKSSGKLRQFHWIDSNRLVIRGTPFNDRIWKMRKEMADFFSTLI
jgi:hypothetical protein